MLRRSHSSPALLQGRPLRSGHPPAIVSNSHPHPHPQPTVITGTADIEALTQHLQRGDALSTELRLHLPAHTDAEALARLLAMVDTLAGQGKLTDFKLTVEGSDQGPIDGALREVLANSKACLVLSGETVRPLIFRDLAAARRLCRHSQTLSEALDGFLDMSLCSERERALEVQAAHLLAQIAVETGEDALLCAVQRLSPCYQWRFTDLPDPQVYARLVRVGLPCCLDLKIKGATARSLADWLHVPHPRLEAIALSLVESLDADTSMPLWTRLVNQPSVQRVELDIASGVTIDWLPRTEPALAPAARLNLLRIRLRDLYKQTPPFIAEFMEWFQPVNMELRSLWVTSASTALGDIEPVRQRPMRSLLVVCEHALGPLEPSLTHALIPFLLKWGHQVQEVRLRMQHALAGAQALRVVDTAAAQGLQLRKVELVQANGPKWAQHLFEKPLRVALHRGEFFQAYLVGAVEGFFQHHLLGMADPVDRIVEEEWLSTADALSLDRVSSQTRQTAVQRRRLKQAQVLVQAMRDQLLDPPTLRELLMGPSNELDADLVAAVFQHLCDAPEDAALWALFDEATAVYLH